MVEFGHYFQDEMGLQILPEGSLADRMAKGLESRVRDYGSILSQNITDLLVAKYNGWKVVIAPAIRAEAVLNALGRNEVQNVADLMLLTPARIAQMGLGSKDKRRLENAMDLLGETLLAGPGGVMVSAVFKRPVAVIPLKAEVERDELLSKIMVGSKRKQMLAGMARYGWPYGPLRSSEEVGLVTEMSKGRVNQHLGKFESTMRLMRRSHLDWYAPFVMEAIGREFDVATMWEINEKYPYFNYKETVVSNAVPSEVSFKREPPEGRSKAGIAWLFNLTKDDFPSEDDYLLVVKHLKRHLRDL